MVILLPQSSTQRLRLSLHLVGHQGFLLVHFPDNIKRAIPHAGTTASHCTEERRHPGPADLYANNRRKLIESQGDQSRADGNRQDMNSSLPKFFSLRAGLLLNSKPAGKDRQPLDGLGNPLCGQAQRRQDAQERRQLVHYLLLLCAASTPSERLLYAG